jgi:hypothetical protein
MRAKIISLAVVATFAIAAPAASAEVDVTNTPQGQQLLAEAQSYWHATAPCPDYTILVGPIVDQPPGVEVVGEAAMPGCEMRIGETQWLYAAVSFLCVVAIHEYGHSLGEPHNADPLSVMNPSADLSTGKPADCTALEIAEIATANAAYEAKDWQESAISAAIAKRGRKHRKHTHKRKKVS